MLMMACNHHDNLKKSTSIAASKQNVKTCSESPHLQRLNQIIWAKWSDDPGKNVYYRGKIIDIHVSTSIGHGKNIEYEVKFDDGTKDWIYGIDCIPENIFSKFYTLPKGADRGVQVFDDNSVSILKIMFW